MNSIGDADIDTTIVALVLEKKEKEREEKHAEHQKREVEEKNLQVQVKMKPSSKNKKRFHEYMTNDSVLGKLDSGDIDYPHPTQTLPSKNSTFLTENNQTGR